jgi:hypothetical protein
VPTETRRCKPLLEGRESDHATFSRTWRSPFTSLCVRDQLATRRASRGTSLSYAEPQISSMRRTRSPRVLSRHAVQRPQSRQDDCCCSSLLTALLAVQMDGPTRARPMVRCAPRAPREIRDVPTPHLVRGRRCVLLHLAPCRRFRPTSVDELPLGAEKPVYRRLRRQIAAAVGQLRHDLLRR